MTGLAAVCGRVMRRREVPGFPLLDDDEVTCGRPEGHAWPCRSEASLKRRRRADMDRWDDHLRERRNQRRRAAARVAA